MSDLPTSENDLPSINTATETAETTVDLSTIKRQLLAPMSSKVDIPVLQEKTRGRLATWLLVLLATTLVGIGFYIFESQEEANIKRELITLVWTSLVTLVGSALGFYFGSKGN
jgi:hypothetical protein